METRSVDAVNNSNFYLKRFGFGKTLIKNFPDENLNIIVTIPSFAEPNLQDAVKSLLNCIPPKKAFEIIILVNQSEVDEPEIITQNLLSIEKTEVFFSSVGNPKNVFLLKDFNLPKKHAGVGLARKLLMDEAVRRFEMVGNKNGLIVCFDADSEVEENYFITLEKFFLENEKIEAAGLHFEHPFEELPENSSERKAIVDYELHLRYYIQALKFANHPFAFHTIGSSMVVKNSAYQAYGGMNKRKAGEDFYFLQKIIPHGGFGEIYETKVIPSPRESNRVPFGTGKAVGEFLNQKATEYNTYNFEIFKALKPLFESSAFFYDSDLKGFKTFISENCELLYEFFEENNLWLNFEEVKKNTNNIKSFEKRYFNWLNAFMALKMVHYLEVYYKKQPISLSSKLLLAQLELDIPNNLSNEDLLRVFRNLDKKNPLLEGIEII